MLTEKILFIRPPLTIVPTFEKEGTIFLPPLGYISMASLLKKEGFNVKIIDCCIEKIGWKKIETILKKEKPTIVCAGSHFHLFHEDLKLFELTKKINQNIINIAGGIYFTFQAKESIGNDIDFIVKGEGENTLLELIQKVRQKDHSKINGIVYKNNDKIIETYPRPLIENLDELPIPNWDLIKLDKYGIDSSLIPNGTCIEHSRGCLGSCSFCILWKMWGENDNNKCKPKYRSKSVKRTVDEIEELLTKYKKTHIYFVDDNWGIDSDWNNDFCEEVFKRKLKFDWTIHNSASNVVRDYKKGIFQKMVKCGLVLVQIGVERSKNNELKRLNKFSSSKKVIIQASKIINKYPQIFFVATSIIGLENDNKKTIAELGKFMRQLKPDLFSIYPITPFPGTEEREKAITKNSIEIDDFSKYDWVHAIMSTKYLSVKDVALLFKIEHFKYFFTISFLLGWIRIPKGFRRNVRKNFSKFFLRALFHIVKNKIKGKESVAKRKFKWYDK